MKRILVIEDEEPVRRNIIELLTVERFDVRSADNGVTGLRQALQNPPDLIICDVMIPGLDGYGVLSKLRRDPTTASIPFIFLTAKSEKQDFRNGMDLGADDYLTKPYTRIELLNAIQTRLRKQQMITERHATEMRQVEEKLERLAHYDAVTGLPNAMLFRERLSELIPHEDLPLALFYVGLDRFSRIADHLGPSGADAIMNQVADRLRGCFPHSLIARIESDHFAILQTTVKHESDAAEAANAIRSSFMEPLVFESNEFFITTSIGIVVQSTEPQNLDEFIQRAKAAMNHASRSGGNQHEFYAANVSMTSSEQLALEASLRHALQLQQLDLHYQPQVNLLTGEIMAAEALLRWRHPDRGFVPPSDFIPIAEETGLIMEIGEWAFRRACNQLKVWQQNGYSTLRISVNLSGRQFAQRNLADRLMQILTETGVSPSSLELEVTESILMQNMESAEETMRALKSAGIWISIDDFGTGYSSLGYLKRFPFDILKIDRTFVRNLTVDSKNPAITAAIIEMAHALDLKVVAEGVEAAGELFFLYKHQCDAMQGYLFSRPIPAAEFEELLSSGKRLLLQ